MADKVGTVEFIIAGFGGQGVLFIGRALAFAGLARDVNVSFIPSYGPEMRGGTANCKVVVSDGEVGSPIVEEPDVLIAMNRPSLERFVDTVKPGGTVFVNSSLIENEVERGDIKAYRVPFNELAREAGAERVANLAALGAYVASQDFFTLEDMEGAVKEMVKGKRVELMEANLKALRAGYDFVRNLA